MYLENRDSVDSMKCYTINIQIADSHCGCMCIYHNWIELKKINMHNDFFLLIFIPTFYSVVLNDFQFLYSDCMCWCNDTLYWLSDPFADLTYSGKYFMLVWDKNKVENQYCMQGNSIGMKGEKFDCHQKNRPNVCWVVTENLHCNSPPTVRLQCCYNVPQPLRGSFSMIFNTL